MIGAAMEPPATDYADVRRIALRPTSFQSIYVPARTPRRHRAVVQPFHRENVVMEYKSNARKLSFELSDLFVRFDSPGNVRQLAGNEDNRKQTATPHRFRGELE